jgi:hypothetical protein
MPSSVWGGAVQPVNVRFGWRVQPVDATPSNLPLPGPEQVLHPLLNGISLRHKQICASREFDKPIEGTGITCENDYAARSVETIGIGFVLSRGRPFVESEVGIFDCCYLDIGILVNQSGANVVTEEQLLNRYRAASIGNSDLGTE